MRKTDYAKLVEEQVPLIPGVLPVVVWDKDSTLAHTLHRQHMLEDIRAGKGSWEDYSQAAKFDLPMAGPVTLLGLLRTHVLNVVVSGASECSRQTVEDWAAVFDINWSALVLRPDGDHTPNEKFKVSVIAAMIDAGHDVRLVVEDYPLAGRAVRAACGVPVLLVNPDYPEDAPHAQPVPTVRESA